MKKSLIFALCILILCVFSFVSCGGGNQTDTDDNQHQHTFDYTKWTTDETHHWYGATCEHSSIKISLGAHIDADDDGVCDTCTYDYNHEHTFDDEWTMEGSSEAVHKHYYARTCSHTGVAHKDEGVFVDENKDGVCDVCSWSDANHKHTYQIEWTIEGTGEGNHKHYYKITCAHTSVGNKDEGAFLDENKDGVCDTCKWYDESHTHTYNDAWAMVGETEEEHSHSHLPSCSHTGAAAKDFGTFADVDKNGVCDVCVWSDANHTHTYNEEKWEQNSTHHGYVPSCSHTGIDWKDYAEHTDTEGDLICDVCSYDLGHVHSFDYMTFLSDYKGHWFATTCGHSVRGAEAAEQPHQDANNDGTCDFCDWFDETHTHTYDEENWVTIGSNAQEHKHYHVASCEHSGIPFKDEGEFVDENNDGICDVCEAVICAHDYDKSKYLYDIDAHWYKPNCGHNVKGSYDAHNGTDDGKCDICGAFVDFAKVIESATSIESANKVVSGTITRVQYGPVATTTTTVEYLFGKDNFLYVKENVKIVVIGTNEEYISTTEYWYSLINGGNEVLVMMLEEGMTEAVKQNIEISVECINGYYFPGLFADSAFTAYGVEQLIYKFYDFENQATTNAGLLSGAIVCNINPENGRYTMLAKYNGYDINVEFELDEDNVITGVWLSNTAEINSLVYEIKQTKGERTELYPFEDNNFIESIVIKDSKGNVIDPSKTIVIDASAANNYYLTITPSDYNTANDGIRIEGEIDIIVGAYTAETGILLVKGLKKGTSSLTIRSSMLSITLNFQVELPAPKKLESKVHYSDGGFEILQSVQTYVDVPLGVEAFVNNGEDPSYIAELIEGEGASFEWDDLNEYYTFVSGKVGSYKIKLTSLKDSSKTTILEITVKEKPNVNVAEILSGKYEHRFDKNTLIFEVIFTPKAENATEGTLWFNDLSNESSYAGVYNYKYLNGRVEIFDNDGVVSNKISISVSELGVLTITAGNHANTKPVKVDTTARDVLIGKYEVLDASGNVMYNIIFTPTTVKGAENGALTIQSVSAGADTSVNGKFRFSYENGALVYTNYLNTVPTKVKIPLKLDSDMKLSWEGYTLRRVNFQPNDTLNGTYLLYSSSRSIYGEITFDYDKKTFTIKDYNDNGLGGTYSFSYDSGLVTVDGVVGDGYTMSIYLTNGLFFTRVSTYKSEVVDGETVFQTSQVNVENYLPPQIQGDGTKEHPFVTNNLSGPIEFENGASEVYYTYTPQQSGNLVVIFDSVTSFTITPSKEETYTGKSEYKILVEKGVTYTIVFNNATAVDGKLNASFSIEEVAMGTDASVPYSLPLSRVQTNYSGFSGSFNHDYMWFAYTATADCTIQISVLTINLEIKYGTDIDSLTEATVNRGQKTPAIELQAGEVLYVAVRPVATTGVTNIGFYGIVTPKAQ